MPIIDDPFIANYIQRVGEEALRQVDTKHFDFDFWVIDNPVVNAFAIPGGHIFMFRGIIELMDDKDELMGVIFHEMASRTGPPFRRKSRKSQKSEHRHARGNDRLHPDRRRRGRRRAYVRGSGDRTEHHAEIQQNR